jgi:Transcriptional regulatory protein, C terminal
VLAQLVAAKAGLYRSPDEGQADLLRRLRIIAKVSFCQRTQAHELSVVLPRKLKFADLVPVVLIPRIVMRRNSLNVANRGRLVSNELFDAVWPSIAVTDDALVQSVGELRRALGADGARFIKTIPRRGYRFEAEIETAPETPDQTPCSPNVSSALAPALAVETNRKTGWRIRSISLFVVVCLAAAGLLWAGLRADTHVLDSPNKSKAGLEAEAQPAIAILPFVSQVQGASQDYFADGCSATIWVRAATIWMRILASRRPHNCCDVIVAQDAVMGFDCRGATFRRWWRLSPG